MNDSASRLARFVPNLGILLGPVLGALVYALLPAAVHDDAGSLVSGLEHPARATAALGAWMALWWLTEALPISATALLPVLMLPLLDVMPLRAAAAPYARELILLFFGGFLIGLAMEKCNLHRRIALLTLSFVGDSPRRLVAGFMLATALMSMWVSNTATALLMLPIAVSVLAQLTEHAPPGDTKFGANFARCLMLGIAYAASIGGIATLVGTPPNLVLAAFIRDHTGADISMARWILVMLPVTAVFLPVVWLLLTRFIFPIRITRVPGARELVSQRLGELGPMSRAEWSVFVVFVLTAIAWVTRPLINKLGVSLDIAPLKDLGDATIAVTAALVLFVIPVSLRRREFVLDWRTAERMPWGILILFGGGLSLAAAISSTGLDKFIGQSMAGLSGVPPIVAVLIVTTTVVFLTELTSNTAIATAVLPVLAAAAPAMGVEPAHLLIPATIGASFAFMLPVATPPNAIVFGSGRVSIPDMAKAGFILNLIGIALAVLVAMTAGKFLIPAPTPPVPAALIAP